MKNEEDINNLSEISRLKIFILLLIFSYGQKARHPEKPTGEYSQKSLTKRVPRYVIIGTKSYVLHDEI